jgi:regulator of protease activity HflC (stomatin/prohibitin superfamily)
MKKVLVVLLVGMISLSCTGVDSGFESPIISYGGETNMDKVLDEGMHFGLNYIWDDTPQYEIREQTMTIEDTYYDNNDMSTPVTVVIYFNPIKGKTNYLHKNVGPDYSHTKLDPIARGALAKVIPHYTAQDLNKNKRDEAEMKLKGILAKEASTIYVTIARIQFTKVGIPSAVAKLATETAVQLGRNELASKKEAEQVALAKAKVATAQGDYDAGILNAKTKDILSSPKMLEMMRIENERIMWQGFADTGKSPFGENNIFGGTNPTLLLNKLKK